MGPMRRPRVIEEIRRRFRSNDFVIEDDRITELPNAEAKEKAENESKKLVYLAGRRLALRFHVPRVCL